MTEHVLDANVFIHATRENVPFDEAVTVPAVVDEMESREAADRFGLSDVEVYEPSDESVEVVETEAAEKGEDLSAADVAVLALALERDATVVTDDYGMQNVAEGLGVRYEGLHQGEIDEEVEWKTVCSSCGIEVDGDQCPRCGGEPERVSAE